MASADLGNLALESIRGTDAGSFITSLTYRSGTDTTAPQQLGAITDATGQYLYVLYNETLGSLTAMRPLASAFTITATSGSTTRTVTATGVLVSQNYVRLSLNSFLAYGETISLGYTAPTVLNTTANAAIQDQVGNDAASFSITASNSVLNPVITLPGWSIYNQPVHLDGGSTVAGWTTPADTLDPCMHPPTTPRHTTPDCSFRS